MKKIYFFVLFIWTSYLSAQPSFEKIFNNGSFETATAIFPSRDTGFLLIGSIQADISLYPYNWDIVVLKTNDKGDTLWTKTYGAGKYEGSVAAVPTNDYGLAVLAWVDTFGGDDLWLVKINYNGDTLWTKYFGDLASNSEIPFGIIQTSDHGFFISAIKQIPGKNYDFYYIKTDSIGNIEWDTTLGGNGEENNLTSAAIETDDNNLVILGSTQSSSNGGKDFCLMKISPFGDSIWTKTFGTAGNDIPYHIEQTTDSGFVMLGKFDTLSGDNQLTLIKTDKDGNLLWQKHPSKKNSDMGKHFKITDANGFIIIGFTQNAINSYDVLLIKTDENGDTAWTKSLGGSNNDEGVALCKTIYNGFGIIANTEGFGDISNDIYFILTDSNGNIPCPATGFIASDTVFCGGKIVHFINTTIGTGQYNWSNNGNVFSSSVNSYFYFDTAGTYHIELSDCKDTTDFTIVAYPVPVGDFTFQVQLDTVIFTMSDTNNLVSFDWNFGDGISDSINKNPVHVYSSSGLLGVKLTVTNSEGCSNSVIQQINIMPNGIDEFQRLNSPYIIFPNPFKESTSFKMIHPDFKDGNLKIYDVLGRLLKEVEIDKNSIEIRRENLESGIYLYHLTNKNNEIITIGKMIILE